MGDRLVGGWTNEWLGARMGVNVGGVWPLGAFHILHLHSTLGGWVDGQMGGQMSG